MATVFGFTRTFTILFMYVGQSVSKLCANGRCCDGFMLDENTNNCRACPDGFIGRKCEKACEYPNYGKECQFPCKCSEALCNVSVGCVQATTIILLETTAHESSRRMLHSRHVKAVQQTTSTL
nr:cell death abnormality protein 1 [Crassostrea gigas]